LIDLRTLKDSLYDIEDSSRSDRQQQLSV